MSTRVVTSIDFRNVANFIDDLADLTETWGVRLYSDNDIKLESVEGVRIADLALWDQDGENRGYYIEVN